MFSFTLSHFILSVNYQGKQYIEWTILILGSEQIDGVDFDWSRRSRDCPDVSAKIFNSVQAVQHCRCDTYMPQMCRYDRHDYFIEYKLNVELFIRAILLTFST